MQRPKKVLVLGSGSLKIEKFWSRLKHWQKGGLIGLLLGLFSMIGANANRFMGIFLIPGYLFIVLLFWITGSLPDDPLGPEGLVAAAFLFTPLIYAVFGALIGLIIGKIKKK